MSEAQRGPLTKNDEGPPTHIRGPQRHEQGGSGEALAPLLSWGIRKGLAVRETPCGSPEEELAPPQPSLKNAKLWLVLSCPAGDRRSGPRAPFADEPAEAKRRRARREVSEEPSEQKRRRVPIHIGGPLPFFSRGDPQEGSRLSEPPLRRLSPPKRSAGAREREVSEAQRGPLTNTVARGGGVGGPNGAL